MNPATGNVFEEELDIPAEANTQLSFSRFYNSLGSDDFIGNLDLGWMHNYEEKLLSFNDGAVIDVVRRDGRRYQFVLNGSTFTADPDVTGRLLRTVDASGALSGYVYYDPSGFIDQFDALGRLTTHTRIDGYQQMLTYSTADLSGVLSQVFDSMGHTAVFSYVPRPATDPLSTSPSRLAGVKINNAYGLTYSSANAVVTVTYADNSTKVYTHAPTGAYNALTSTTDEMGQVFGQHTYDPQTGQALSAQTAPQIGGGTITYAADGSTSTAVDVNGTSSQYTLGNFQGVMRVTAQSQPAGSGCGASNSAMTYDANGNMTSADDFNGGRSCSAFDPVRNLETSSVSGLNNTISCNGLTASNAILPVGSSKRSTQWHPDWPLRTALAEPGKLTTKVYNGQPDPFNGGATATCAPTTALLPDGKPIVVLCKQVEQATTDANGSLGFAAVVRADVPARQSSWTYNQVGQVLTATDPLGQVTTYSYYTSTSATATLGDLLSITNAAQQVTTFTQYNAAGQVLQSQDPNGVITTNTYDQRLRLLTTTTAGETTSYAYYPTGQLQSVTQPNGAVTSYTYDGAHRPTQVTDGAGNVAVYTLDASGNRVGEQVKDVNGAVARTITRSFDPLGRMQQVTGAPR